MKDQRLRELVTEMLAAIDNGKFIANTHPVIKQIRVEMEK